MTSMDDPEKTFSVKDSEVQLQSTTGATPSVQSDETVNTPNTEEQFPEGGSEAWLTVLGAYVFLLAFRTLSARLNSGTGFWSKYVALGAFRPSGFPVSSTEERC